MTHPIIACARSYLGTRFHHQGRLKKTASHKGGIDCLGLLAGVATELDLRGKNGEPLAHFDQKNYPHQPDTAELRRRLEMLLAPVPLDHIIPADIALFDIQGAPQHMGIISDNIPLPLREGLWEGWELSGDKQQPPPTQPSPSRGEGLNLIHAYAPARSVVEHAFDAYWREKMVAAFRISAQ